MKITEKSFDLLLESWARWCMRPDGNLGYPRQSALMSINSGGGGGSKAEMETLEESIEAAVMLMAVDDAVAAEVLRAEYGAKREYEYCTRQSNCKLIGISLPSYKNDLRRAKAAIRLSIRVLFFAEGRTSARTQLTMEDLIGSAQTVTNHKAG